MQQTEKPFVRNDRVEVLRGRYKGKLGTYDREVVIGEAYPVLMVFLDGKREEKYFTPGDLKKLPI